MTRKFRSPDGLVHVEDPLPYHQTTLKIALCEKRMIKYPNSELRTVDETTPATCLVCAMESSDDEAK